MQLVLLLATVTVATSLEDVLVQATADVAAESNAIMREVAADFGVTDGEASGSSYEFSSTKETVRDHVLCDHGQNNAVPWRTQGLAGQGAFGAQTVYVFAAVVGPTGDKMSVVAFVKDQHPRFMWDHMQTSYDSEEILGNLECVWGGGMRTPATTEVEFSVDGNSITDPNTPYMHQWDRKEHIGDWKNNNDIPAFQNVVIVTCAVPAGANSKERLLPTVQKTAVGKLHAKRGGDVKLALSLCARTQKRAGVSVCGQPVRKQCTGKCPSPAKRAAGWAKYLARMEEWVVYGKAVGIDRFYMYDRDGKLDEEPRFKKYYDDGTMVKVNWPAFSDDWKFLPVCDIPNKDWSLWKKSLADTARVDFTLSPNRADPNFDESSSGVVFNKDPIVFDQVIAVNHCFYTNRFSNDWLASNDPDEYWHAPLAPGPGALKAALAKMPASVGEMGAKTVQYGKCPAGLGPPEAADSCDAKLTIEQMQCHHPTANIDQHMKYCARPTHVKFGFVHQINGFEKWSSGRKVREKEVERNKCAGRGETLRHLILI